MLLFIIITFIVCIILYYFTSSNYFLLAAKTLQCPSGTVNSGGKCVKQAALGGKPKPNTPGKPKPNTPGKPKPNTPGKPKPAPGGKPKPTPGKPKPNTGKPKPSTSKPKPSTGKPKPTTGKPKPSTSKPKPSTGKPNTPPPHYKPDSSGKCKKGDSLYQGKCFTPTNLSQYAKYQLIDIGPDLPMAFIRGRPVGSSVPGQVNGKPVKAVSAGSNIVAYLQGGQVAYGTVDANGNIKPVSGKERNPIVALGVAAVAAVAGYLMGQVDDPKQKALINKQVMAPFKGAGKIPNADVTALGLKPGQTYYSNGQQYNIYTGKDGNTTVGVIPCKGKCKDNVNVKQALTLKTVANPWASVGNAPIPGVTKEDMKPGTVYTAKDGKTYQVTKDGKGFEQCNSRTELRSLEYRGIGGSITICGSAPRPGNSFIQQAINSATQGMGTYNQHLTVEAHNYMTAHPYNSYASYAQSVGENGRPLSQAEFNQIRNEMGLPPALGQSPMNYDTFNAQYQNSPITRFLSPLYNSNRQLDIATQQSIQTVQDWLTQNPIPNGTSKSEEVTRWLKNLITNNRDQLSNIVQNSGNTQTNFMTLLNNFANQSGRNNVWNSPNQLGLSISSALSNSSLGGPQYASLRQFLSNRQNFQYNLNTSTSPTTFTDFQSNNQNNPVTSFLSPLYTQSPNSQLNGETQSSVAGISNWLSQNPIQGVRDAERPSWIRNFISSNLSNLEAIAMSASGNIQGGRQQITDMISALTGIYPTTVQNMLPTTSEYVDIVNKYGQGKRQNYLFLEKLLTGKLPSRF